MKRALSLGGFALAFLSAACAVTGELKDDTARLEVTVTRTDGEPVPGVDDPACVDLRGASRTCPGQQTYLATIEAKKSNGERDTSFRGFARLNVVPGTLVSLEGDGVSGRNVQLSDGLAENIAVTITGSYGETRLAVEDVGYVPVDPNQRLPACGDGVDNDDDGLTDFPADPGCAFANDDTEEPGTFASGVSAPIQYKLPTVSEANGFGAATPYPEEGVEIDTSSEGVEVIVTRVSTDGFYVADMDVVRDEEGEVLSATQKPYGSLFVFNFGVPPGMRVCDRLTLLAGTMTEFFGYTEMSFPSFRVKPWDFRPVSEGGDGKCLVPEPQNISGTGASSDSGLEPFEGGMVRVENAHVSANLGPGNPGFITAPGATCAQEYIFDFGPDKDQAGARPRSNCDFNGDGKIDFTNRCGKEFFCSEQCYADVECSEWSAFRSRGNFRLVLADANLDPRATILANAGTVPNFSAADYAGQTIISLTGTVSNFSGGDLRWTIETRCEDDLVFCPLVRNDDGDLVQDPDCLADPPGPLLSESACVRQRTSGDNDAESQ